MGRSATGWTGPTAQPGAGADGDALACVIVNPSKPAVTADFRRRLARALRSAGYRGPVWLDTTVAEPGATQARLAVASGARLVIAVGGDGTVRAVAAGLAGTDVELGVVPLGTANLAARNLGLPVGDLDALIDIAVFFSARPTDLAWVRTTPCPSPPETGPPASPGGWARPTLGSEHACLVVAGIGFDAALVAVTSPALKARIKWGAYALAALENLRTPRMELSLGLVGAPDDDGPPGPPHPGSPSGPPQPGSPRPVPSSGSPQPDLPPGPSRPGSPSEPSQPGSPRPVPSPGSPHPDLPPGSPHPGLPPRPERLVARCLLIANGGRLPAGIVLIPGARMDDGLLDVAAIDTVAGLAGWTSLARQVLPPFAATYSNPSRALGRVRLRRGTAVTVHLAEPALVQVDGELLAPTRALRVRMDAGALLVRCPE